MIFHTFDRNILSRYSVGYLSYLLEPNNDKYWDTTALFFIGKVCLVLAIFGSSHVHQNQLRTSSKVPLYLLSWSFSLKGRLQVLQIFRGQWSCSQRPKATGSNVSSPCVLLHRAGIPQKRPHILIWSHDVYNWHPGDNSRSPGSGVQWDWLLWTHKTLYIFFHTLKATA